jgi:hypothetical protein
MIGTIVAGAAGVIAVPAVGGLAYRQVRQRRAARALAIDTPNGIVEHRFVTVGGIDQWIQSRGEDRDNPVLLVLHGGPGWPNAVFTLRSWRAGRQPMGKPGARPPPGRGGTGRR